MKNMIEKIPSSLVKFSGYILIIFSFVMTYVSFVGFSMSANTTNYGMLVYMLANLLWISLIVIGIKIIKASNAKSTSKWAKTGKLVAVIMGLFVGLQLVVAIISVIVFSIRSIVSGY